MKNNKLQVILWSVLAIALAVVLVVALVKQDNSILDLFGNIFNISTGKSVSSIQYDDSESYLSGNVEIKDEINSLNINWLSGEVIITSYKGKTVKLEETAQEDIGEEHKLFYKTENGHLTVQPCKSDLSSEKMKNYPNKTLNIYIPADMASKFKEAVINSVSAKIRLGKDIKINKLTAVTVSGEISVNETNADTFSINTTSGDVICTLCENNGFTLDFNTVSGEFESDFALTVSENTKVYKNGECDYRIETVSGDVSVMKK